MKTISLEPVRYGEPLRMEAKGGVGRSAELDRGFGDVLKKSIAGVNAQMNEADVLTQGLVAGEHGNIHETMIAVEKAGISFRLMTKVQQKAIEAYQEMMRIQL